MRIPEHIRPLYQAARRQGWTVTVTGGNHLRWRSPSGAIVFTAGTPSDGKRDLNNVRTRLRRAGLKIERG